MKKGFLLFFMLIVGVFSLSSCNKRTTIVCSKEEVKKIYTPTSDVDSIILSDIKMAKGTYTVPVDIVVEGGTEKEISLTGQPEILDSIVMTSTFGTLNISGNSNATYYTDSLKLNIKGYKIKEFDLELSTIKASDEGLSSSVVFNLNYASFLKMESFKGKSFTANLKSKSRIDIKRLELSSSLQITEKEQAEVKINNLTAQEAKFTLGDQSEANIFSNGVENSIYTLNNDSYITVIGNLNTLDLVLSQGHFNGKDCTTRAVSINAGYGKSLIEVKATESISVNSAVGNCKVVYYGGNPTITKTNITGEVTIENANEGQE